MVQETRASTFPAEIIARIVKCFLKLASKVPYLCPSITEGVLGNTRFLDDGKFSFGSLGLFTERTRES